MAQRLGDNPFHCDSTCPAVCVAGGHGPYENTRRALEAVDLSCAGGRRVLLKPNVGRVTAIGAGVTTHPEVLAAAINAFVRAGAEVAIGESPIVGVDVNRAFEAAGVAAVARRRGCRLIDLDRRRFVEGPLPEGQAIGSLRVCRDVLEYDVVVSVPVMKTHMHTGVTLAVKNMKGCLWRRSKVALHMLPPLAGSDEKPINVAIADMASVLRPHLAIIDGTVGMEGLGPGAGQPKPLDTVVVSCDAFAADAVACQLMGFAAARVPHLQIGAQRGYGVIDLERLLVSPTDWRSFTSAFVQPPANLSIQFPDVTVLDNSSCSACQSTLLLFLQRYQDQLFDYFPGRQTIDVAIGKGHRDVPAGTLLVGNCTGNHRDKGTFVPGCPPVGSQILSALASRSAESQSEQL
jgi:uncharacterized protein (DUF362 family)